MIWFKVNLVSSRSDAQIIEEILVAHNAISISMFDASGNNPIYEPRIGETPLWHNVEISALFEETITKEIIDSFLEQIPYSNLIIKKLHNQNWIEKYQESSKPIRFGKKLWVVPFNSQEPQIPYSVNLKMDPGLAFGSGSHETTHLCLEYLDQTPPRNFSVLDYGCGSGILAIAAIKLGAHHTYCLDIDPQAIISTKDNSRKNNVDDKIKIISREDLSSINVDLIISNILFNTLMELRDCFYNLVKNNGQVVLSGIMKCQLELLVEHYEELFTVTNIRHRKNWSLVELRKH